MSAMLDYEEVSDGQVCKQRKTIQEETTERYASQNRFLKWFLEAAVAGDLDDGSEDEADGDDELPGLAVCRAWFHLWGESPIPLPLWFWLPSFLPFLASLVVTVVGALFLAPFFPLQVLDAGVFPALGPFTFAVDGSALTLLDGCLKVVLGLLYSPQVGALIGPMAPPFCWRSKVVVYPGAVCEIDVSSLILEIFVASLVPTVPIEVASVVDLDVLGRLIVKFSSESPLMVESAQFGRAGSHLYSTLEVFVSLSHSLPFLGFCFSLESLPFLVLFVAFPAPSPLEVDFLEFGGSTKNNSKDFNTSFGVGYSMMTTDIFVSGPIEVVYNALSIGYSIGQRFREAFQTL
ncbi:hypothetical protein SUGI_0816810 [Cryptomeria japonica]|nr:hypothetical protein SUGI_0816810 [Cryptomeria japonica]